MRPKTGRGELFVMLDFNPNKYPNLESYVPEATQRAVVQLDYIASLPSDLFLAHLATEINNFVFTLAQNFSAGTMACVAGLALLEGNRVSFLTYGDVRLNLFSQGRLFLLNGAKYKTPAVVEVGQERPARLDEDPPQMGRQYWTQPLREGLGSLVLGAEDCLLIFTDGLEEKFDPQECLAALRKLDTRDPDLICQALMKASDRSQDDRALVVICGPYEPYQDPEGSRLEQTEGRLAQKIAEAEQGLKTDQQEIQKELAGLVATVKELDETIKNGNKNFAATVGRIVSDKTEDVRKALGNLEQTVTAHTRTIEEKADRAALDYFNDELKTLKQGGTQQSLRAGNEVKPGADTGELPNLKKRIEDVEVKIANLSQRNEPEKPLEAKPAPERLVLEFQGEGDPAVYLKNERGEPRHIGVRKSELSTLGVQFLQQPMPVDSYAQAAEFLSRQYRPVPLWPRVWVRLAEHKSIIVLVLVVLIVALVLYVTSHEQAPPNQATWRIEKVDKQVRLAHVNGRTNSWVPLGEAVDFVDTLPQENFRTLEEVRAWLAQARKRPHAQSQVEAETQSVKVEPGDDIRKLADRYSISPDELKRLNSDVEWGKLKAGQFVKIPGKVQ